MSVEKPYLGTIDLLLATAWVSRPLPVRGDGVVQSKASGEDEREAFVRGILEPIKFAVEDVHAGEERLLDKTLEVSTSGVTDETHPAHLGLNI